MPPKGSVSDGSTGDGVDGDGTTVGAGDGEGSLGGGTGDGDGTLGVCGTMGTLPRHLCPSLMKLTVEKGPPGVTVSSTNVPVT